MRDQNRLTAEPTRGVEVAWDSGMSRVLTAHTTCESLVARGSRLTGWRRTDCGGLALSPLSPALAPYGQSPSARYTSPSCRRTDSRRSSQPFSRPSWAAAWRACAYPCTHTRARARSTLAACSLPGGCLLGRCGGGVALQHAHGSPTRKRAAKKLLRNFKSDKSFTTLSLSLGDLAFFSFFRL